jgi:hypothetical protein
VEQYVSISLDQTLIDFTFFHAGMHTLLGEPDQPAIAGPLLHLREVYISRKIIFYLIYTACGIFLYEINIKKKTFRTDT